MHSEAANGAYDQDTSGTQGKTVVGPAPTSWSFRRAELPEQGCGERFMTVVDDDTNVDCERRRRHTIAAPCSSFSGTCQAWATGEESTMETETTCTMHCCLNTVEHRCKLLTERDVMKSIIAYPKYNDLRTYKHAGWVHTMRNGSGHDEQLRETREKQNVRCENYPEQHAQESSFMLAFLLWTNNLLQLSIPKGLSARSCQGHVEVNMVPRNLWNRRSGLPAANWLQRVVTASLMICSHTSSQMLRAFSSDLIRAMSYVVSATMNSRRMLSKVALGSRYSLPQQFSALLKSAASSTICPARHVPLPLAHRHSVSGMNFM